MEKTIQDEAQEPAHDDAKPLEGSDASITNTTLGKNDAKIPKLTKVPSTESPPNRLATVAVFVGLALMIICIALDRSIVATAIPKITSEFHSLPDVGWYGSAYLMTTCSLQLFFGKLYTEFQVKWVFLAALAIFEVGSVICAAAPSSVVLIIGRAVAGAGCAGLYSGAFIIVRLSFPIHKLPQYSGVLGGISGLAQVIAPTLGGVFTDKASWRWCFWINLPIGGITFFTILFFVTLPAQNNQTKYNYSLKSVVSRFDLIGTAIFIPANICLLLALQWGGVKYGWASQYVQGNKATLPLVTMRQRSLASGAFYSFCYFAAFFLIIYYVPIWFQAVSKIGYYVPNMIASVIVTSVGCGLICTFDRQTSTAKWAASLVIMGMGVGVGIQQPIIAAQTIFTGPEVAISTSILIFLQTLSGTVFLSVAQNSFESKMQSIIRHDIPSVNPEDVLNVGASELGDAMRLKYPSQVDAILDAYNRGLRSVFIMAVIFACLGALGLPFMEWRSVKKAKNGATSTDKTEKGEGGGMEQQFGMDCLILQKLPNELLEVSPIPGYELILECYHPTLKISTPYLSCRYLGTRHPGDGDVDDADATKANQRRALNQSKVCQLYASFIPVVTEENRRRPFRMIWPATCTFDDGVLFSQLCTAVNLVTVGKVPGSFVTHYNMSEHVVRVFRRWLGEMAAAASSDVGAWDGADKVPITSNRILWVDGAAKNIGLRFHVSLGPVERMPLLSGPEDEDPAVSYTLTYQGLPS
ncbi:hypothetical protein NQ176_g6615 [Zarea fungicola]|uniref:Uncharacterized protein n=1 Tax=Zarea fungicola TaxID=93591 RepID=A0ACC1N342_9HYPO|nr:hypothetical protein NQ176_g6615 [Lecanicillium fungicola]